MNRAAFCGVAVLVGIGLAGCDSPADKTNNPPAPPTTSPQVTSDNEVLLSVPGMH